MNTKPGKDQAPPVTVNCPTCSAPVTWDERSPWRPFCSRRCQLIDLDEWLTDDDEEPGVKQE
ncbi:DNA gyrase inhibitor YacG [Thiolapillus sp.]